ncbi:Lrp/AsnC family transcriptional regulator [Pseudoteredinibacter isoporae]|uniref:Lrp/AsnC family leucine-responsive transcriptional regulator n=1 Tax=Pseudoteredinibacter isoporae TaxID=570281 RepID=A0A7X0MUC1_9GAMM|nr:Lrp/AsnC family transcriptional regulator [Pseudoteredinibacter isoporae]MBB6519855.1 Lrp/AsnC family leucine-responsive transcriptional regulator [Pseudoteredinibacter isoporae]NHO85433.1 Lrp/AsnC family transcriptional regulator [Pseudoteredinibacter isoporae]NIB26115.1 Lrp/AsnC family transcriptional regulator [Pseudoteredinibacter isoporae]
MKSNNLDRIDIAILSRLQENNRIANQTLAAEVGLSPPACLQRVKRLRESGLILKEVAVLDPQLAGHGLQLIVSVEMERDRKDIYRAFSDTLLEAKEVTQCYEVTGEMDFILLVSVRDIRAYEKFIDRVLNSNVNIRKFHTSISIRTVKFETALDLQAESE